MSKITESARGEECLVRIPGHCNWNPETVVFAHRNGGGIGMKNKDNEGAYCCSGCHDVIDGREITTHSEKSILIWFYQGIFRTQKKLIEKGLMVLK